MRGGEGGGREGRKVEVKARKEVEQEGRDGGRKKRKWSVLKFQSSPSA